MPISIGHDRGSERHSTLTSLPVGRSPIGVALPQTTRLCHVSAFLVRREIACRSACATKAVKPTVRSLASGSQQARAPARGLSQNSCLRDNRFRPFADGQPAARNFPRAAFRFRGSRACSVRVTPAQLRPVCRLSLPPQFDRSARHRRELYRHRRPTRHAHRLATRGERRDRGVAVTDMGASFGIATG